jgi:hypothetical protein
MAVGIADEVLTGPLVHAGGFFFSGTGRP